MKQQSEVTQKPKKSRKKKNVREEIKLSPQEIDEVLSKRNKESFVLLERNKFFYSGISLGQKSWPDYPLARKEGPFHIFPDQLPQNPDFVIVSFRYYQAMLKDASVNSQHAFAEGSLSPNQDRLKEMGTLPEQKIAQINWENDSKPFQRHFLKEKIVQALCESKSEKDFENILQSLPEDQETKNKILERVYFLLTQPRLNELTFLNKNKIDILENFLGKFSPLPEKIIDFRCMVNSTLPKIQKLAKKYIDE